jgi:membrane protein DedA with SNARE-associated domain
VLASLTSGFTSGLTHFHGITAYALVAGLVIGESGFVIGFFVPGEIAVVIGGVLAEMHHTNLVVMVLVADAAAIAAFFIGYAMGTLVGPWLLDHRPLKGREAVARTQRMILRFGGPAALVGRFVAVVRAFVPALIGISDVPFPTFALFNVIGGLIWATGYTMLGYTVGSAYKSAVSEIGDWSLVLAAVVVLALVANHVRVERKHKRQAGEVGAV